MEKVDLFYFSRIGEKIYWFQSLRRHHNFSKKSSQVLFNPLIQKRFPRWVDLILFRVLLFLAYVLAYKQEG